MEQMPQNSVSLYDLLRVQGSMFFNRSNSSKRKPTAAQNEDLEDEFIPTEMSQCFAKERKRPHIMENDKENDCGQFVLSKRSRRKKDCAQKISWDQLPDELLLRILWCLPLQDLLRTARVCQRWNRLVFDESLWNSVDLVGMSSAGPALQQLLKNKVRRLRCPRTFVGDLQLSEHGTLQLVQLDLSSSTISTVTLESILSRCRQLECLSLEGLKLSDPIISSLADNTSLVQLNLCGCSGFNAPVLGDLLKSCTRLEQLNISWCIFDSDHVKSIVNHVSPSVTHLNLSGYRETLNLDDVKVLVKRCPNLLTLDLNDSSLLMADCLQVLAQLPRLQHLCLSRCYHIHLAALTDVGTLFPSLCQLDIFGLVTESHQPLLKNEMPHININSQPFSNVGRPTPACPVGGGMERLMWDKACRLSFKTWH
ncbi:S-phase kinase-associated protein 2 isoform X1 [Synchiropus splendidus]|uniref:S-phase kinase-associated protein 2 isoform X1 n=1 Tax=Synchiropus splendidus TaxID=270530 RepID=UPI00237D9A8B|nr:S-phase kinase-associated protein 2 isoform X1 [Synchiropus splendidus]